MNFTNIRTLFLAAVLAFTLPITAQAALVVTNQGEGIILDAMTTKVAGQNLILKLYSSNTVPDEGDTAATYTTLTEANGYTHTTLTPASWVTTLGAPTETVYPQAVWTFTGAVGNVYGYILVQSTSGFLVWAERFTNGPYNIQNNGDQIKVTAKITME